MIYLYKKTNTDYTDDGDFIIYPLSATLKMVLNGSWELSIEYPTGTQEEETGDKPEDFMQVGAVFAVDYVEEKKQLYVIDNYERNESSISCTCYPLFMMDAKNAVILESNHPTNANGQQALDSMLSGNGLGLKAVSDITKTNTAYYEKKNFIEALSGSDDNSFLNRWGGEIYYSNKTIKVMNRIGKNRGLRVQSGFNLRSISVKVDSSELTTKIYPQAYNGYIGYPAVSPRADNYRTVFAKYKEYKFFALREDVQDKDDQDQYIKYGDLESLKKGMQSYVLQVEYENGNQLDVPDVTYTIDMVDLRNFKEYENLKDLLYVWLGDYVHVIDTRLELDLTSEVVELEYDCINQEITSLTLGKPSKNYFDLLRR